MDPMTFVSDNTNADDDNNLRPSDINDLIRFFTGLGAFGDQWVISIFCFELRSGPGVNRYPIVFRRNGPVSECTRLASRDLRGVVRKSTRWRSLLAHEHNPD